MDIFDCKYLNNPERDLCETFIGCGTYKECYECEYEHRVRLQKQNDILLRAMGLYANIVFVHWCCGEELLSDVGDEEVCEWKRINDEDVFKAKCSGFMKFLKIADYIPKFCEDCGKPVKLVETEEGEQ